MFVVSKRNIILPGPNGEKFHMPRDYMGSIPTWAENSAYLKALEADGKVIISTSSRDKDIDASEKKKRGKKSLKVSQEETPAGEPSQEETPAGEPSPPESYEPSGEEIREDS